MNKLDNFTPGHLAALSNTEMDICNNVLLGRQDVEHATLEWADWFNHHRLLEPIGNTPMAELEMVYYRQLEESAMVA